MLFDLYSRILASKMTTSQTLAAMRDKLWDRIKTDNTANSTDVQAGGLGELPVSCHNPRKVRFELCAPLGPLPTAILYWL